MTQEIDVSARLPSLQKVTVFAVMAQSKPENNKNASSSYYNQGHKQQCSTKPHSTTHLSQPIPQLHRFVIMGRHDLF
ncbi:hypothetical protein PILCRDRAFT_816428, partial [Piloderma croceum F 1598]